MVDEVTRDIAEDMEKLCEDFKTHSSKAERVLDHVKMAESGTKPLPEFIEDIDSDPRDYVSDQLDKALRQYENALELFRTNTIHLNRKRGYDQEKPISELIRDPDFIESETSINSHYLNRALEEYKSIANYASRNGVDLDTRHFEYHDEGAQILESAEDIIAP